MTLDFDDLVLVPQISSRGWTPFRGARRCQGAFGARSGRRAPARNFRDAARRSELHHAWLHDRLAAALAVLDDDALEVVRLHVIEGWELEVVAEMVGRPDSEVSGLLRGALAALRAFLERAA